ncbi:hypothetical protein GC093_26540 [Paenibacillus sp. LMG 31456]|uniref:Lipoprotein n=1 Tax=Paenibacillus foliorum TaxID=2654974 RepID=A0A972H5I5_9BACL|nr:hypothetical protein [Paenibacillus foliorum]NOU96751.1 hypothetical protein [Paenibacillus foliorum]
MRKWSILLVCLLVILTGCSKNTASTDYEVRSVVTELTKQDGLDNWKLAMVPRTNTLGQQGYDIEFINSGNASVTNVTVYYRIDSKEKLSSPTVKADSKTVVSKLDPHEKISLADLTLPINTPISMEVDWLEGNHISKGTGIFKITESK